MARRLGIALLWTMGWALLGGGVAAAAAADAPMAYDLQLTVGDMEGSPFGLRARPGAPLVGSLELLPPEGTSNIASVARFALTIGDTTWSEADVTHSKISLRGGEVHWRDSVLRATKGTPPLKIVLGRYVNAATDERDGTETLSFARVTCQRCTDSP